MNEYEQERLLFELETGLHVLEINIIDGVRLIAVNSNGNFVTRRGEFVSAREGYALKCLISDGVDKLEAIRELRNIAKNWKS